MVAAGSYKHKEPPEIRGRGYVVASLEAALWAFHKRDSFEEGALLAVNLREDADTTGAIYGQLAGAYYGEQGILQRWKRKLAHRLVIEYFAEQLFCLGESVEWEKLLRFLLTLERLGSVPGAEGTRTGWPDADGESEMTRFYEMLYTTGVVYSFAWSEWHHEAEQLFRDSKLLASADEMTLRKLLTYHPRVDHFNEGHFGEMIETGHIAAILRRIKELQDY